jgi:single-strand DNA-binding protein
MNMAGYPPVADCDAVVTAQEDRRSTVRTTSWDSTTPILDPARERTSNRVEIVGYIGGLPEQRYTAEGVPTARLSLATHRWHQEDGQMVQSTDWHTVVAFGDLAEPCEHLRPGDLVRVNGWLHTRVWTERGGSKRRQAEVVLTSLTRVSRGATQATLPFAS